MANNLFSFFMALSAGLLGACQGSINAHIGKVSGQYAMIIGVSLIQAIVAGLILLRHGYHSIAFGFSPWMFAAGVLGVTMMFGVSSSISSIGASTVFVLVILGQILSSALIDHFGLFGAARMPLTPQKIGSILVIMSGVLWLIKAS